MNKSLAHILVVDDDNGIRSLVKKYLNENNFLVSTAENAENASEKVKVTAEKAKETAATKVENKARKDGVAELHQKLREAGHRATKADAAALHDTHNGDIDAALDQKNKDKKEQEAKVESANTLPDGLSTPDEIKQEFGL